MVRIERNKKGIITAYVCLAIGMILCVWTAISIDQTVADVIFGSFVSMIEIIIALHALTLSYRSYEFTASGITRDSIFHIKRHNTWSDYPYCYLMWMEGPRILHFAFVFSKKEIDDRLAKKMNKLGLWLGKPYSFIVFDHSPEREEAFRRTFPELKIEYRNTFLAKRK